MTSALFLIFSAPALQRLSAKAQWRPAEVDRAHSHENLAAPRFQYFCSDDVVQIIRPVAETSHDRAAEHAVDQQILQRLMIIVKRLDKRRDHRLQLCLTGAIEKVVAVDGADEARRIRLERPHQRCVGRRHEPAFLADKLA